MGSGREGLGRKRLWSKEEEIVYKEVVDVRGEEQTNNTERD